MIIFMDTDGGGGGGGGTPVYESFAQTANSADATSMVCNMPSGITAGDVLVALVIADGSATITAPGDWSTLSANQAISGGGGVCRAFWKVAAGSDTLTVSTSASEKIAAAVFRISSATTAEATFATGTATPAAPPSITPAGGSRDYVFIVGIGFPNNAANPSADPSGYSPLANIASSGGLAATNVRQYAAYRSASSVSSESPGTAAYANATQWGSYTVAVW